MTIRELSRKLNIPYSTTRKYLKALEERGFITLKIGERGAKLDDHTVRLMTELVNLVKAGNTLQSALDKLAQGIQSTDKVIIEYLQRLEKRIEELERENRALRDLVQLYLSKVDEIKGLPKPRRSFFERLRALFKRRKD